MTLRILGSALVLMTLAGSVAIGAPAVTINGAAVPYEEYVSALEMMTIPGPRSTQQPAGEMVLERIVWERIIIQLAEKEGVPVTDEQIERRYQSFKKDLTPEMMKQRNLTEEQMKKDLHAQQAVANLAGKSTEVSDNEIKNYYLTNSQMYKKPLRVRIGAIISADKERINQASAKLKNGDDFATVAAELSEDPMSKQSGGSLGWVSVNQPGVPPTVTNTAITLKVGAASKPFKVEERWVIIKSFERQRPTTTPIEEVKDSIRESIAVARYAQDPEFRKKMQDFQRNAVIEIGVERFKSLEETLKARIGQQ